MSDLASLEARVIGYQSSPEEPFESLLHRVVTYQARHNAALREWWKLRGFAPEAFTSGSVAPEDVPAVPTDVFRHVRLVSDEREPSLVFRTSGTTSGTRGEHWRLSTAAYDHGALLLALDRIPALQTLRQLVSLTFRKEDAPDSSLAHMVAHFGQQLFAERQSWHFSADQGLQTASLRSALHELKEPTLLFGTAFALVEALESRALAPLPQGSVVVETGGYKGRTRDVPRKELHASLGEALALPPENIGAEYGMTELSSQYYAFGEEAGASRFRGPHWCRAQAVDPDTLELLEPGRRGLLRFVDLANVDSVVAVQTSDFGCVHEGGSITLEGRRSGAVPRGCSLAVEEISSLTGE